VKERPILFSGPMVRAILSGTKTQTRRVVKPQPGSLDQVIQIDRTWHQTDSRGGHMSLVGSRAGACPYGAPGDRLWIRETCRAEEAADGYDGIRYPADNAWVKIANTSEPADAWLALFHYGQPSDGGEARHPGKSTGKGVPSIHMPRWASRLTLEITDVRVQRLQDISDGDARAEGVRPLPLQEGDDPSAWWEVEPGQHQARTPVDSYRKLWNAINGRGSWDANPWVWAVSFKRIGHVQ